MQEKNILQLAKWLIIVGLVSIFLTVIIYFQNGRISRNDIDNDTISGFGQFVGGFIGTLFSLAAVLLIWVTYNTQKKEFKQTGELLRKQRFEDTFFNLTKVQREIRGNINFESHRRLTWLHNEFEHSLPVVAGDNFFEFAMEDFHRLYIRRPELIIPRIDERATDFLGELWGEEENIPMDEPDRRIKSKYKKFFDNYHIQLSHYFRHLYYILKFIQENENEESKLFPKQEDEIKQKYKFYAGILQAQMSSAELFLLFYNGRCFKKMKSLISKYNLLENLSSEDLADPEEHQNLYGENVLKTRRLILE
jgi:hypothetical protein